jgi:hypothetical protein
VPDLAEWDPHDAIFGSFGLPLGLGMRIEAHTMARPMLFISALQALVND